MMRNPKPSAQYEKPYCAWTLNPRPHSQAVVAVIPDRFSLKACRGPDRSEGAYYLLLELTTYCCRKPRARYDDEDMMMAWCNSYL